MYKSIQTVGSLLLTNSDFRLFLSDLGVVSREVFRDTAFALSAASKEAGERLEPWKDERESVAKPGNDETADKPVQQDLEAEVAEVGQVLGDTVATVAQEAESSIINKLHSDETDTLLYRLKQAVTKLRDRRDYSDSVSTFSLLLKRYAMVYSRIARDTLQTTEEAVDHNPEMDKALENFCLFIKSFGEQKEWEELEKRFKLVIDHAHSDPEFEKLIDELGNAAQEMFTDPSFFDHAEERFQELRDRSRQLTSRSSLRDDIDGLLSQLQSTFHSVMRDRDISGLLQTTAAIGKILSPKHHYINTALVTDCINVFVPLLIQAVNYIPIPRLEIATPEIDILLENLILEPGKTINHTSFFPYKLRIETLNDIEIRKARFRTTSAMKSLVRIKIDGLSVRAEEVGFWMKVHTGLLRYVDEGIASFAMDERGMDLEIDVEVGRDRMDKILSLRSVRCEIHKLDFTLRQSKFSWLAWLFKPFVKPVIKKTIEMQIAMGIAQSLQFANREILFARERLRATRIADPDDLKTFLKAVLARLTPPDDPDVNIRLGVTNPGRGVFDGVYAPGSIVKLWNEEATQASQRIRENDQDGWRNSVFDVHTTLMT